MHLWKVLIYLGQEGEGARSKFYTSKIKNCVHVEVAISVGRKVRAELLQLVSSKLQQAEIFKEFLLHVMNINRSLRHSHIRHCTTVPKFT